MSNTGRPSNPYAELPDTFKQWVQQGEQPVVISATYDSKFASVRSQIGNFSETSQINIEKKLGAGSFGTVYLCSIASSNAPDKQFAIKTVQDKEVVPEYEASVLIQKNPHPCVITTQMVELPDDIKWEQNYQATYGAVMPFMNKGSLEDFLDSQIELSASGTVALMVQLKAAVDHFNSLGIIHRDLAARNVLLNKTDDDYQLAIADYGLARCLGNRNRGQTQTDVGPLRIMPPDALKEKTYSRDTNYYQLMLLYLDLGARLVGLRIDNLQNELTGAYDAHYFAIYASKRSSGEVLKDLYEALKKECALTTSTELDNFMKFLKGFMDAHLTPGEKPTIRANANYDILKEAATFGFTITLPHLQEPAKRKLSTAALISARLEKQENSKIPTAMSYADFTKQIKENKIRDIDIIRSALEKMVATEQFMKGSILANSTKPAATNLCYLAILLNNPDVSHGQLARVIQTTAKDKNLVSAYEIISQVIEQAMKEASEKQANKLLGSAVAKAILSQYDSLPESIRDKIDKDVVAETRAASKFGFSKRKTHLPTFEPEHVTPKPRKNKN